jgi:sporulation protein YlmC with PRC-barrel domain
VRPLSELQHRKVVTESGRSLGRMYDLRCEQTPRTLTVVAMLVGFRGMLEHFGIVDKSRLVPWKDVVRIEGKRIVVRDQPR